MFKNTIIIILHTHTQTHTKWIRLELSNTTSQPAENQLFTKLVNIYEF